MVLVYHHVFTIGQLGVIIPFGFYPLGFVGAINPVYDGAFGNRRFARFSVMNRFLREWFVANDKDGLVNVRRRVASKVFPVRWKTNQQYSSPQLVRCANSSSEILPRPVVNGRPC